MARGREGQGPPPHRSSSPRMIAPQSSESSWEVFGLVTTTGSPAFWIPEAICSLQSLWISPDRYTVHSLVGAVAKARPRRTAFRRELSISSED